MAKGEDEFKLIRASRLIDGKGGQPLEDGAILVRGDQVLAVGAKASVAAPDGASVEEYNYEGKTVLPGLIDCHVHLIGIGDGRAGDELTLLPDEVLTLQAARNARDHLYTGVTTLRDCAAKNQTTLMLRMAMEMGITVGPRLVLAARPMAIVGGHLNYFGVQATGPIECRAAVRQVIKEGADFIKITATGGSTRTSFPLRPSFNPEEINAICDEAHKFGKHTVAHCTSSQGMVNALDAGIDTIVHAGFKESDGTYKFRPEIAERMASQSVFVNPTFQVGHSRVWALEKKVESGESLTEEEQERLDTYNKTYEDKLDSFTRMRDLGVTMVCGSDSSWGNYQMGQFQIEIEAHARAGMSSMEAIVSATRLSAGSLWLDDEIGTIEPGKKADLLVVDGDPARGVEALWDVADVFQRGDLVDRQNFV